MGSSGFGRVRVERGIYRQPNGKYAVCWRHAGRLRSRRSASTSPRPGERLALIAATREGEGGGLATASLRDRRWLVARALRGQGRRRRAPPRARSRRPLPARAQPASGFGQRAVAAPTVDDVAELSASGAGTTAKTAPSALATLQSVMRFTRVRLDRSPARSSGLDNTSVHGCAAPPAAEPIHRQRHRVGRPAHTLRPPQRQPPLPRTRAQLADSTT